MEFVFVVVALYSFDAAAFITSSMSLVQQKKSLFCTARKQLLNGR